MIHSQLFLGALACSLAACTQHKTQAAPPPPLPAPPAAQVLVDAGNAQPAEAASSLSALAVKWSDELELAKLSELEAKLNAIDTVSFGELSNAANQAQLPTTCVEWAKLRAAGYEPTNTLEQQPDNWAVMRCRSLELLRRAQPARESFVRELRWDKKALAVMPAQVLGAVSDDEQRQVDAATANNLSIAAYDRKARVTKSAFKGALHIRAGDGASEVEVVPMAWGDFNRDGVDDLVVGLLNSMTEGSLSYARVLVLTRLNASDVLRAVAL